MEITTALAALKAAMEGIKLARQALNKITSADIRQTIEGQLTAANESVVEVQGKIFELQAEMLKLQQENNELKAKLSDKEEWKGRFSKYKLVETSGGATVYQSNEGVPHYACPSCIERKEIQILQNQKSTAGIYRCPGCDKYYKIKPSSAPGVISSRRRY